MSSGSTPLLATSWRQYSVPPDRPLSSKVTWRLLVPLPTAWKLEKFLPPASTPKLVQKSDEAIPYSRCAEV